MNINFFLLSTLSILGSIKNSLSSQLQCPPPETITKTAQGYYSSGFWKTQTPISHNASIRHFEGAINVNSSPGCEYSVYNSGELLTLTANKITKPFMQDNWMQIYRVEHRSTRNNLFYCENQQPKNCRFVAS